MALRLSKLFGRGGSDQVVMKDGGNNVTLENAVAKVDPLSATQAGGDGDASGLVSEVGFPALGGNSAAREAGSGMAAGVHDIHMNQGDTQSLQQSMQNENRQLREDARTQPPEAPEADGVVQHNQTDLEFARAPRPGVTSNNDHSDSGPLEIKFEDMPNEGSIIAKWEGPDVDASKNEVAIESLEIAHEGILAGNGNHNQQGVVEDLNVKYELLDGEEPQNIGVKYTGLIDDQDPGASGVTEDATDGILNIKSDSEVTDYREGGTSLDDFNPKEAANFLPEVNDEVLVQFQGREPGRIEFPNLGRGADYSNMPMEEVGFIRGTGRQGPLDDDGPSTLLGDADGDGRIDTTDAMSLNFEEVKISGLQDGIVEETESDFADLDIDGLPD